MDERLSTADEPQGVKVTGKMSTDLLHQYTHELFNKTANVHGRLVPSGKISGSVHVIYK